MIANLKTRLFVFISSWLYLLFDWLIFIATKPHTAERINTLVILSLMSLGWALLLYQRIRLIEDTSDTLLHTAAQGYVEVRGKVSLYEDEIVRGLAIDLPPMVWYQSGFKTSSAGFILEDDKGRCTIDPRDAEIITPLYNYNNRRYHSIYPGEFIYVLGQLETLKKHKTEYEREGLIASKVINWKKNQNQFIDYFDSNKDGIIDATEMDRAKDSATRLVDEEVELEYQKPPTHVISTPEDGRPFLLSSIHPEALVSRYRRAMFVHISLWLYLSVLVLLQ